MGGLKNRLKKILGLTSNRQTVLVYSMGKVGSTSLYNTLRSTIPDAYVFHSHFLSDHWLKERLPAMAEGFHINIKEGERVHRHLANHPTERIKVITLVREPLIRDLSDVFENWEYTHPDQDIESVDRDELIRDFHKKNHEYTLTWFDTEFRAYTGFDIYSQPFPTERGFAFYKHGPFDILCIKLESLNDCYHEALSNWFGEGVGNLTTSNESENKKGSSLYAEMKQNYKAPEEKLDMLYGSKYARHFYSEDELMSFRKRWSHED
ncbi:MAG: hypothetical protein KDD36_10320 [Flavobacteriales bacterium]|nr:hypothetical protein [Flavobacteriales bacterium]